MLIEFYKIGNISKSLMEMNLIDRNLGKKFREINSFYDMGINLNLIYN